MNVKTRLIVLLSALIGLSGNAFAQGVVETVEAGCADEIKNFCSQVSPGEGRLLACFYAHEDKLSGRCQYALYQASNMLDQAVSALNYVAGECENDIVKNCADVQMGEGRIIECLRSNPDAVSAGCMTALNEVFE